MKRRLRKGKKRRREGGRKRVVGRGIREPAVSGAAAFNRQ